MRSITDNRSGAPANGRALSPTGAFTLLAVACLTIMVGCVIVPGLPSIGRALGVGDAAGWLITLPSLGVVLFGPIAGRLIDRIGPHRALCAGLFLYALLGAAAVLLRGPVAVFADRILLGGATSLVMAGGTALISEFYSGEARLTMIARQGMAIELGGVIFLSIGGYLTAIGWAAPFSLYGVAIVFLAMVFAFVPSGRLADGQRDVDTKETSRESTTPVLVAALCSMLVFFTAVIVLPFRLSQADGVAFSEAEVGYFLSFVSLVAVGFAAIMPKVTRELGERGTLIVAFGSYGIAHLCFAFAAGLAGFALGAVLLGAGFGLSIPLVNHMTVERSPAHLRGRNLARLSMAIFLGQFLASFLDYLPGGILASFLAAAAIRLGRGPRVVALGSGRAQKVGRLTHPHALLMDAVAQAVTGYPKAAFLSSHPKSSVFEVLPLAMSGPAGNHRDGPSCRWRIRTAGKSVCQPVKTSVSRDGRGKPGRIADQRPRLTV